MHRVHRKRLVCEMRLERRRQETLLLALSTVWTAGTLRLSCSCPRSPASTIRERFSSTSVNCCMSCSEESAGLVGSPTSLTGKVRSNDWDRVAYSVKVRWTISASFSEYRRTVSLRRMCWVWPAQSTPSRFMCWRKSKAFSTNEVDRHRLPELPQPCQFDTERAWV